MNKNEIKNIISKSQNKKELLNIISEFSNNYKTNNEIFINNLINLISFYENLALIFETLRSKIIFPKIETKPMFKNDPSLNAINKFYNHHLNYLKYCKKYQKI